MRIPRALLGTLMAVGCAERPSDMRPWPDTTSAEWILLRIGGDTVVSGTRATLATSPGGEGGYSGCNWYGVRRDSARAGVEMTARECAPPIAEQERRFTRMLTAATRARYFGDTLALYDSASAELGRFIRRHPTGMTGAELAGTRWSLNSGSNLTLYWPGVTLAFQRDSVSGFGGCRNYRGTYTARDDRLRFPSLAMSTTECPHRRVNIFEDNLTTAFSETEHFDIRGDTLFLMTFGGDTLQFIRR
jgi:heat shock protein HslJ